MNLNRDKLEAMDFGGRVSILADENRLNILKTAKRFKKYGLESGYKTAIKYDIVDNLKTIENISYFFTVREIEEAIKISKTL